MPDTPTKPANSAKTSATVKPPTISANQRILDIVALNGDAVGILSEYGLHCASCELGAQETLDEGCKIHGFEQESIDALVEDLNDALVELGERPANITITESATKALEGIAEQEKQSDPYLEIMLDENGGFCMEFRDEQPADSHIFTGEGSTKFQYVISPETLWRIADATIDVRDGRFKLDVPEEYCPPPSMCCNGEKEECGCS